jgi:hypothetical protein
MKRAGADIIVTYFAKRAAELLYRKDRSNYTHDGHDVCQEEWAI